MIDPVHLLGDVIRPVLRTLGLWSINAERLVLGTACKESNCGLWLHQLGIGPALGIFQMEVATHDDCYMNFLDYKPELKAKVMSFSCTKSGVPNATEMCGNLSYAAAMCRIKYLRDPSPIPSTLPAQAAYWKRVYNTVEGAGTVEEYILAWNTYITGVV